MKRGAAHGSVALVAVAVWMVSVTATAGTPPKLRFDPFRPRPEEARVSKSDSRADEVAFEPVLFSTVTGGENPMANLGGEILSIGDETHGYRLVAVRAFDALFAKDGEMLRLEVVEGERSGR